MTNNGNRSVVFDIVSFIPTIGILLGICFFDQYRTDFLWVMFFGGLFYLSTEFFAREPLRFTEKLLLFGIGELSGLMLVGIGHLLVLLIKYIELFMK